MSVMFEHDNLRRPLRQDVLEVLQAALVGADPYRAVRNAFDLRGDTLAYAGHSEDLKAVDDIHVLGAGKAAAPMAQAVEDVLEGRIRDGVVAVKDGYVAPTTAIAVGEAAHPVPDRRSLKAAHAISHVADEAERGDLVINLISGGGSAVAELPAEQLSLSDLRDATATLLAAGLPIEALNAIRKHLSAIKGGRLAERIAPARHLTVVVSDVVGDRIETVASGPTVPDPTTFDDALEIIEQEELEDRLPFPVIDHLKAGAAGEHEETPGADSSIFDRGWARVICSCDDALDAAEKAADGAGYPPRIVTTGLEGEARDVGRDIARNILRIIDGEAPVSPPACLLYGGETTVTVRGRGKGGRNQELALSAALTLDSADLDADSSVAVGAFATDGTDGPTRAAGAIVGLGTADRIRAAGFDPGRELRNNNSFPLLEAAGDLIRTGPTCNNVNDIVCVLID